MSTHNLCFEQKYKIYQSFLSENFQFLEVKFSIYLNRRVFVMSSVLLWLCFVIVPFHGTFYLHFYLRECLWHDG